MSHSNDGGPSPSAACDRRPVTDLRLETHDTMTDPTADIAEHRGRAAPPTSPIVANRIVVEHLNIYYGDFLAVEDVNMVIEPRSVTALIGPSGCGKSTFLRSLNRMHEVIAGARVEGTVLLDGVDLYGPKVDPVAVRRKVGMVFQRPNPFPTMSIYDNVLAGKRLNSKRLKKAEADAMVEQSLRGANLWEEVKDRLGPARLQPLGRAAAAAVHRPGDRRRARGAADGRAVLGARPDLHAGHRGADERAARRRTRS